MKLQKKAIIYFCMILVTISLVFYFASNYFLTLTFGALEQRDVNQNVHRVINALDNEHTSLNAITGDYAGWDDMYNYVNQPTREFIETNFIPETLVKQRLNTVLIINARGQLVYQKGYDFAKRKESNIPLELINRFRPGSQLLVHSSVSSSRDGIVLLPEGPMVISVRPIITSQYKGPIHGTLVMGRYLNAKEIARLEDLTAISFDLLDIKSAKVTTAVKQSLIKDPTSTTPPVPVSDELVSGYRLINDIYGQPNIVVKVTQGRDAYELGTSFFRALVIIVNSLAFLAGMVVIFFLLRRLFLRLNSLTIGVSEIKDTKDLKVRMPILGDDEISTLAQRINEMIASLETSHGELVESEERYRGIVQDQTEYICRFDYNGKINFVNDALAKAMGRKLEDLVGPVTFDFIPKNEHQMIREDFLSLSVDEPTSSIEFHIILPDGTLRWHQWTNRAIFNENGEFLEFQSVGRDITERKEAEEQIMLDEMRLEALVNLNQMTDATLKEITDFTQEEAVRLTGSKMGFLAFIDDDQACMTMHSWSSEVMQGCQLQDVNKTFDLDSLGLLGEPLRQRQPIIVNNYSEPLSPKKGIPKGHMAFTRVMCVPVMDGDNIVAVAGVGNKESEYDQSDARQLTLLVSGMWRQIQRRKVEQALKESEQKLSIQVDHLNTLINNLNEVFMTFDREANITFINKKCEECWGYRPVHLVGRSVYELLTEDSRHVLEEMLGTHLNSRGMTTSYEVSTLHQDGKTVIVRVNSSPIIENGEVVGGLVLIEDITDRKRAEEELKYLSMHDQLTGLYNRNYFEEEMRRLEKGRYNPVGIVMCDVDGLKLVNDTLGHNTGDVLLTTAAAVLGKCFRNSDVVARVGGDEFAIVVGNCDRGVLERLCERIRSAVEEYNQNHPGLPLSMSLGLAVRSDLSVSLTELFREADNNMYREKLHSSRSARAAIVQTLMKALEARDFLTEGHADRLQDIVAKLGAAAGLHGQSLTDLRLLAQFHDIGKVGIPDRILFKPGRLTADEVQEMQRHSEIGHRIALSAPDLVPIAEWILKHHEWWNGEGYPLGLAGEDIPLECRILAIADAYDAITSDRPYRRARPHEKAIEEIERCAGTQFDPRLVAKFLEVYRIQQD
ncbi:MAG: PAS domain S-box protein [Acidobacteriota bacterium]